MKKLLIIHEYGAPSHYYGAELAAKELGINSVKYIEFSTIKLLYIAFKKRSKAILFKAVYDFLLLSLYYVFPIFLKDKIIIIGMAPLDWRVVLFNRILSKTNVTYHSSWLYWDGSKYPKSSPFFKDNIRKCWEFFFLKIVKNYSLVTAEVQEHLVKYWGVNQNDTRVVYHCINKKNFYDEKRRSKKNIRCIFVGRVVEDKGIKHILKLAEELPSIKFIIVGDGEMSNLVKNRLKVLVNLSFEGYISDKTYLRELYSMSDFILLPSQRSKGWEELFGISLIEAMVCGCVPIVTDHKGPQIILNGTELSNFVFNESLYYELSKKLLGNMTKAEVLNFSSIAKKRGEMFMCDNIKKKWLPNIKELAL